MEGVPFANGAPNLTVDVPAMLELSREREVPKVEGKTILRAAASLKQLWQSAISSLSRQSAELLTALA